MLKTRVTYQQAEIIRDICNMQIQSLIRTSSNNDIKNIAEQMGIEIDNNKALESISEMIRVFDNLKYKPEDFLTLEEDYFSLFKHNLFVNDEEYSRSYLLEHKKNLWAKIIIKESFNSTMN